MLKEQFLKRNERSAVRYLLKVLMYSNCFLLRVHFKILLSLRTLILITVSASFTCVIAFCGQGKRCGWEYMGGAKKMEFVAGGGAKEIARNMWFHQICPLWAIFANLLPPA